MLVKRVFKKQMKEFAVQMMEEYAATTDNDVDDALVLRVKKAMRVGVDGSCFLRVLWDLLNEFMLSSVESIQAFAQLGL